MEPSQRNTNQTPTTSDLQNIFCGVPNVEAMKCLEGFSTWPSFVVNTETGSMYRSWFRSKKTSPHKRPRTDGGVKKKTIEPAPPSTTLMPPPRSVRPRRKPQLVPGYQHRNSPAPVFPTLRAIPVTSTVTSGSVAVAHVSSPRLSTNIPEVPAEDEFTKS